MTAVYYNRSLRGVSWKMRMYSCCWYYWLALSILHRAGAASAPDHAVSDLFLSVMCTVLLLQIIAASAPDLH
jgi:hypothetical protein